MNAASVDWGTVPAWIMAATPLILAGVLSRALNRTANVLKDAVRPSRPRTLHRKLRSIASRSRPGSGADGDAGSQ